LDVLDKEIARSVLFFSFVSPRRPLAPNDSVSSARMAVPPREPSLSREQRGVLALLANFPLGLTKELLVLAHGFDRNMIAGLVHAGLATAEREVVTGIEMVRIRITDIGRIALEG
jgi:hypothetical protein